MSVLAKNEKSSSLDALTKKTSKMFRTIYSAHGSIISSLNMLTGDELFSHVCVLSAFKTVKQNAPESSIEVSL